MVGTRHIGVRAASNVLHGVRYTKTAQRPMNTFVTISLITLGYEGYEADVVAQQLLERTARWWRYQRDKKGFDIGSFAYVFVHSSPGGLRHVHWMAHIPQEIGERFGKILQKLLRKLTGRDDLGTALQIKPVYAEGGLAKYLLRGVVIPKPRSCRRCH
jgi:hypothetical protein